MALKQRCGALTDRTFRGQICLKLQGKGKKNWEKEVGSEMMREREGEGEREARNQVLSLGEIVNIQYV